VIEGAGIGAGTLGADIAWGVGDVKINGVAISNKDTDSLIGKINAINESTTETGVTANAFATATLDFSGASVTGTTFAGVTDTLYMNGVDVDFSTATSLAGMVTIFNENSNSTGVTAKLNGNTIVLKSDQGAIVFSSNTVDSVFNGAASLGTGFGGVDIVEFMASSLGTVTTTATGIAATATSIVEAGIKLTSSNGNPISFELGVNAAAAEIGILEANNTAGGAFGSAIASLTIDTQANAQKAIKTIDNALTTINDVRSTLGAINNRLDFTVSNLANISEKTSSARSRITDADFAAETANLSRSQVLQQAATAMLAQSNARPQQVLSLLR
jgi:flagellin